MDKRMKLNKEKREGNNSTLIMLMKNLSWFYTMGDIFFEILSPCEFYEKERDKNHIKGIG